MGRRMYSRVKKTSRNFVSQKTKTRTTIWSSSSAPGSVSRSNTSIDLKRDMHPSVHGVLTATVRVREQPKCPSQMNEDRSHTHVQWSTSQPWKARKGCRLQQHAKWNKSGRETQILYFITYMWNLKKYKKIVNITTVKKKQSRRCREQTGGQREEGRGVRGKGLRGTNHYVYNKLQGYIIQHREYSQCSRITVNGI